VKASSDDLQDLDLTNEAFQRECTRTNFHFRCASCAHVMREDQTCSLGYPNAFLLDTQRAVTPDGNLTFCKYFELGESLGW
jgi:hypothetical protein